MILPVMDFTTDGIYSETKHKNTRFENYVYLKIDDKVLKLGVSIDDKILKSYMEFLVSTLDEFMFDIVSEEEMKNCCFPMDMEYVGKFRLRERRKTKNYKIPSVDMPECSLIYVLNSIYDNNGLTKEDLYNLRYEKEASEKENEKKCIIDDIISKLNIVVLEEYDYDKLAESVKYVSYVTMQENLWNKINLQKLKSILLEAEGNIECFKILNLYDTDEFIYPIKKQKRLKK